MRPFDFVWAVVVLLGGLCPYAWAQPADADGEMPAVPPGRVLSASLTPPPGGLRRADFELWQPHAADSPRAILAVADYEAGARMFEDPRWRRFAAEHRLVLLRHRLIRPVDRLRLEKGQAGWTAIAQGLAQLEESSRTRGLASVPIVFTGLSQAGWQGVAFASLRPDRVAAVLSFHGATPARAPELNKTDARLVPMLHTVASEDRFLQIDQFLPWVREAREHGAPWAILFEADVPHHRLADPSFAMAWLAAVLDARQRWASGQPAPSPWQGHLALTPVGIGPAVSGSRVICRVEPIANGWGDPAAQWLPDEPTARAWLEYVRSRSARDPAA